MTVVMGCFTAEDTERHAGGEADRPLKAAGPVGHTFRRSHA